MVKKECFEGARISIWDIFPCGLIGHYRKWFIYFEIFSNWVLTYANGWSSIRSKEAPILFFLIQRNWNASFFVARKQKQAAAKQTFVFVWAYTK